MRPSAIRLLTLAICASTVALIPAVPASAGDAGTRHVRKHHQHRSLGRNDTRPAKRSVHMGAPYAPAGEACKGIARGIDCSTWPPPFDEDPDRKVPPFGG